MILNRSRLPIVHKTHRYMVDGYYIDYLGQMLLQKGYTIPEKTRFPSQLGTLIPLFTNRCRGVIIDSILTTRILALDRVDPSIRNDKFQELMQEYNVSITWISEQQYSHPVGVPLTLAEIGEEDDY